MAKPSSSRKGFRPRRRPRTEVVPVEFFNPPQGLDLRHPTSRLGTGLSPNLTNLRLGDDDWFRLRPGTVRLGDLADEEIVALYIFTTSLGTEYILRFRLTGVDYYSGGMWIALTGPTLDMSVYSIVSATAWNDKLDFTTGAAGIYEIDFSTFSYSLIVGSPVCRHITTFGSRLVASYIVTNTGDFPSRIQWCVKNDNTDWAGLGSGFDDLLSSPGGVVDTQLGVYPISDTEAIAVRSGSYWTLRLTGFSDAPFEFSSRFIQQRIESQRGVCYIPGGIAVVARDDIYLITPNTTPQSLGLNVRNGTHATTNSLQRAQLV